MYRQIIQDALSLCEEEIVCPYISKKFGIHEVNEAVEYIKSKKCSGKVLIDLTIEPEEKDEDGNGSDNEGEKKK